MLPAARAAKAQTEGSAVLPPVGTSEKPGPEGRATAPGHPATTLLTTTPRSNGSAHTSRSLLGGPRAAMKGPQPPAAPGSLSSFPGHHTYPMILPLLHQGRLKARHPSKATVLPTSPRGAQQQLQPLLQREASRCLQQPELQTQQLHLPGRWNDTKL